MGMILSKEQTEQIKEIRKQIAGLDIDGWMCEGTEYEDANGNIRCGNIFFNNDLDVSFVADYDGNVIPGGYAGFMNNSDLLKYAVLEGKIRKICEEKMDLRRENQKDLKDQLEENAKDLRDLEEENAKDLEDLEEERE